MMQLSVTSGVTLEKNSTEFYCEFSGKPLKIMVGAEGFEPPTR